MKKWVSILLIIMLAPSCVLGIVKGMHSTIYTFSHMQNYQFDEFKYFFNESIGTFPNNYAMIIYFSLMITLSLSFFIIYKKKRSWLF